VRNLFAIVDAANGSLAVFPSPHKFFFAVKTKSAWATFIAAKTARMPLAWAWCSLKKEKAIILGV
jgi:hypothetical protein